MLQTLRQQDGIRWNEIRWSTWTIVHNAVGQDIGLTSNQVQCQTCWIISRLNTDGLSVLYPRDDLLCKWRLNIPRPPVNSHAHTHILPGPILLVSRLRLKRLPSSLNPQHRSGPSISLIAKRYSAARVLPIMMVGFVSGIVIWFLCFNIAFRAQCQYSLLRLKVSLICLAGPFSLLLREDSLVSGKYPS